MLIYRYENGNNHGPYHGDLFYIVYDCNGFNREKSLVYDNIKRPSPYNDIFNNYPNRSFNSANFKYGFRSLKQLKKWFNGHHRRLLNRHGYVIKVYNVDDNYIYFGNRHVCFSKEAEIYSIKNLNTKGE